MTPADYTEREGGLLEALAKIMPINFENGPDYISVYFGDGETHRSQAMTMNPQDWLDLQAAYDAALLSRWQDISTAPKDGTEIQVRIPGHGEDNVVAWVEELLNSWDEWCGAWAFTRDQEPPDCWTDGYCWAVNEDGWPSMQPTHWKPLPEPPTPQNHLQHKG